MNGQVEVTWRILQTITRSIMVHIWVSEKYTHFALICMTDHILPVIPTKHFVNQDGETSTPNKLATGKNPHYQTYVFYFFHVLYENQLHMLKKRS